MNLIIRRRLFIFIFFFVFTQKGLALNPRKFLRSTNQEINKILKKKAKPNSPQAKKKEETIKKLIRKFMDFKELSQRSLDKYWNKISKEEQDAFVSLLGALIEQNYISQLKSHLKYEITYDAEKVNGKKATVFTTVHIRSKGRHSFIKVNYKMHLKKKRWMVYDVITDGVSLVSNYRSQFRRIIKRESYEGLVKRMKEKLKKITKSSLTQP
jgi:phospholipid transport system substrate-binding protein